MAKADILITQPRSNSSELTRGSKQHNRTQDDVTVVGAGPVGRFANSSGRRQVKFIMKIRRSLKFDQTRSRQLHKKCPDRKQA